MSYDVRHATVADLAAVVELAVEMVLASRSGLRPEVEDETILTARKRNLGHLADILEMPEAGIFVAVDESDTPVGHVIVMGGQIDTVTELPQAWVYDVSVQRQWWGRGVGRRLMERAEKFALSLGLEWVGLGVTTDNRRALEFYRELGYEIERYQMVKRLERATS